MNLEAQTIIFYGKQRKVLWTSLFKKQLSDTKWRESRGIEMVIKSDLDQIFIMSEKNGS